MEESMPLTEEDFYNFAVLMLKDSRILHQANAWHNSVYLAGYALEGYYKILLIKKSPDYFGHINTDNFIQKVQNINQLYPEIEAFNDLCLENRDGDNNKWDINDRYRTSVWDNEEYSEKIQNDLIEIEEKLTSLRADWG